MAVEWVKWRHNTESRLPYRVIMPPSHRENGSDHFHAVLRRAAEWIDENGRGTVATGVYVDHLSDRSARVRSAYWFDDQQTAAMFKVFFG